MGRIEEGAAVGGELDRRFAVARAALGIGQRQRKGDSLVEGHQTSGGCSSLGALRIRRGGAGRTGGAPSDQRSRIRAAASRPPRPNASAVAIAAAPRINPNAIITIWSARPMKVRPMAVNRAMIA